MYKQLGTFVIFYIYILSYLAAKHHDVLNITLIKAQVS